MNVVEHLELHLGPADGGWKSENVSILRFTNCPEPGLVTYATAGLSDHLLALREGNVHQELLLCTHPEPESHAADFLLRCTDFMLHKHWGFQRGEVLPFGHPVVPGSLLTAAYATAPGKYPPGLSLLRATEPPTTFVLVVPVTPEEAAYAQEAGWSRFEDVLEATEEDVWDPRRRSILAAASG